MTAGVEPVDRHRKEVTEKMTRVAKRETPTVRRPLSAEPHDVFGSIDRAFERMFEMPTFVPLRWPVATARHWLAESYMPVNEFYRDGALVIRAELPGIDPDKDVQVTVTDGGLHIKANRREEAKVQEDHYLRREIHSGSFERTLPLPEGVTEAEVKATYTDGILEVVIPKADIEPVRKVAISKA
jgi:HSP20 family protein